MQLYAKTIPCMYVHTCTDYVLYVYCASLISPTTTYCTSIPRSLPLTPSLSFHYGLVHSFFLPYSLYLLSPSLSLPPNSSLPPFLSVLQHNKKLAIQHFVYAVQIEGLLSTCLLVDSSHFGVKCNQGVCMHFSPILPFSFAIMNDHMCDT